MVRFLVQIFLLFTFSTKLTKCTIAGISYMDPLNFRPLPNKEDPCQSLYWYPRPLPEYCYRRTNPPPMPIPLKPPDDGSVVPLPIPVPLPPSPPIARNGCLPMSVLPPPSALPLPPAALPMMMPPPMPAVPASVPFGVPLIPSNPMLPVPGVPYPPYQQPAYPQPYPQPPYPYSPPFPAPPSRPPIGMVPGIRGIVSDDGGINILPFSDAYSDVLEKHKNKSLRKKLRTLLDDYHRYPRRRKHRRKSLRYY